MTDYVLIRKVKSSEEFVDACRALDEIHPYDAVYGEFYRSKQRSLITKINLFLVQQELIVVFEFRNPDIFEKANRQLSSLGYKISVGVGQHATKLSLDLLPDSAPSSHNQTFNLSIQPTFLMKVLASIKIKYISVLLILVGATLLLAGAVAGFSTALALVGTILVIGGGGGLWAHQSNKNCQEQHQSFLAHEPDISPCII